MTALGTNGIDAVLDAASPAPLWLDTPARPAPRPALDGDTETDLVVIGGGFTGLWTALRAKERDPDRRVLLLEAGRLADQATGRNGGFCEASLTHGEANGRDAGPTSTSCSIAWAGRTSSRSRRPWSATESTATSTRPGCWRWPPGRTRSTASSRTAPASSTPTRCGSSWTPRRTWPGGWIREGCALVDPARLAWGLADAAESLGVRIAEQTRAEDVSARRGQVTVRTTSGTVTAAQVVLATNAFRPLLARLRFHRCRSTTTCWPRSRSRPSSWRPSGGRERMGISDSGNQFHYYRLTADDRILWGGYDAIYYFGRRIDPELDDRRATHRLLAEQFYETFPQLADVRFTHRWGGVIDTCTRFCAFFGSALRGRAAYAMGFTGLGVGASRFAADVMLDLLDGVPTERTRLRMVRRKPMPFPPEPLAYVGIQLTRWSLARADRTGRRNLWLRTLDGFGLGFDS